MKKASVAKRKFLVRIDGEFSGKFIIADSLEEAKKQAKEMCIKNGRSVAVFEHILTMSPAAIEVPA